MFDKTQPKIKEVTLPREAVEKLNREELDKQWKEGNVSAEDYIYGLEHPKNPTKCYCFPTGPPNKDVH